MANQGAWKKLNPSNAGDNAVILTGAVYDSIVEAMNLFASMEIAPQSNCGRWVMNAGQAKLDLMDVDNRLRALESATGVGSQNTIVNVYQTNVSIIQQIANINSRLDNASATVNCVSNTAIVTFHI